MEEKNKANRRRRERAMRMRAAISESSKLSEDSCEETIPIIRAKPPRPRKKNKDPLFEEDIIDGFAIQSFKAFSDVERCVRFAEKIGSRILDPYPDRFKELSKKRTPYINYNNNKTDDGSHSNVEEGYICDSESDNEKEVSDLESDFFSTPPKGTFESYLDREGRLKTTVCPPNFNVKCSESTDILSRTTPIISSNHDSFKRNGLLESSNHISGIQSLHSQRNPLDVIKPGYRPELSPLTSVSSVTNESFYTDNHNNSNFSNDQKPPLPSNIIFDQKLQQPLIDQKPPLIPPTSALSLIGDLKLPHYLPKDQHTPILSSSPTTVSVSYNNNNLVHHPTALSSSQYTPKTLPASYSVPASSFNSVNGSIEGLTLPDRLSNGVIKPTVPNGNLPLSQPFSSVSSSSSNSALGKYSVVSLVSKTTSSVNVNKGICDYNVRYTSGVFNSSTATITTSGEFRSEGCSIPTPSSVTSNDSSVNSSAVLQSTSPKTVGGYPSSAPISWQPPSSNTISTAPTTLTSFSTTADIQARIKVEPPDISTHLPKSSPLLVQPKSIHPPYTSSSPLSLASSVHNHSIVTTSIVTTASHPSVPSPLSGITPVSSQYTKKTNFIKSEPGVNCSSKGRSPLAGLRSEPSLSSPLAPPPPVHGVRHSPKTVNPNPSALYSYPSAVAASISSSQSLSKPWTSSVSRLSSSSPSHLPRPILPPLVNPAPAPIPPSGIFAPPLAAPQTLVPPAHHLTQDPLLQADILRRELDSRFLASQDRALGITAPTLAPLGAVPALLRTDVHHHQHQHTHVHQHLLPPSHMPPPAPPPLAPPAPTGLFSHSASPSLFKEVSKTALENSALYRPGAGIGSSYSTTGLSSMIPTQTNSNTPFTPPSHLLSVASKKTGRWNAMHVRIAWEIYYDQQKTSSEKSGPKLSATPDLIRSGAASFYSSHPPAGNPELSPMLNCPPSLPPHHRGSGVGGVIGTGVPPTRLGSSPFLGSHLSPSVPRLSGLRYGATPGGTVSSSPSPFHHPLPTSLPGPPPGSMFSRDALGSISLSNPPTSHDAWRSRLPSTYGTNGPSWPSHKQDSSLLERERRDQEERERREKEEREKKAKDERIRREKEELERREKEEKDRREREAKERERERERRAEHEKERLARLAAENERNSSLLRRDDLRSPLLIGHETKDNASVGLNQNRSKIHSDLLGSRKPEATSLKDDVLIVGGKEAPVQHPRHPSHLPSQSHFPAPHLLPPSSNFYSLSPHGLSPHYTSASPTSSFDRSRLIPGSFSSSLPAPGPHIPVTSHMAGSWPDPFRDPYRSNAPPASALHDPLGVARAHELATREAVLGRDHLMEQIALDRAREEHFLRSASLGATAATNPLLWSDRYREQQTRELIDRERHIAAAAAAAAAVPQAGLYPQPHHPPTTLYSHAVSSHLSSMLPPPPSLKPPSANLTSTPFGSLHPHPPGPSHLGAYGTPGLPPPLIPPSLRGPSPTTLPRSQDRKEVPR